MRFLHVCWLVFFCVAGSLAETPMTLEYRFRYNCQSGEPDHLLGVHGLSGHRAIVAGNRGLALVDLAALPVGGTRNYLDRLRGVNARDVYVSDDERYVFVNTHRGEGTGSIGFSVVGLSGSTLSLVSTESEPEVLYEKMSIRGDRLYVAAHRHGLRIFSIGDPENPELIGRLDTGLVDAFAVAVEGDLAYVADGAGGLKIVDVSDETAPVVVAGETLATAAGTSEDVTVRDGRVYVAAGGAGLAVYDAGDVSSRRLHQLGGCAESLCWVGDYLAVGTIHGVVICEIGEGTSITPVASESAHRRGGSARLRLLNGVGSAAGDLVLCANWNYMDVYQLKDAAAASQPDINCDTQRIRFSHAAGSKTVTVTNNGSATLTISSVSSSHGAFGTDYSGGSLAPGEAVSFDIRYSGRSSTNDSGVVSLRCNDPDENPLPIQVFGATGHLDPGEPAPDFTLPTLRWDPVAGRLEEGTFRLSDQRGKVVWYSIFATW